MKKLLAMMTLMLILMMTASSPVKAAGNEIGGTNPGTFGKPTSVEPTIIVGEPIDESSNINRSKDSAFIPPPFGSSTNLSDPEELFNLNISSYLASYGNSSGSVMTVNSGSDGSILYYPPAASDAATKEDTSYSTYKFTPSDGLFYSDGSIGKLSIPKINLSVKVYEEESLQNMKKGVAHFKSTSCWDGNAGFAAHNRGSTDYFGKIHTLSTGDQITYTTKLGTRAYEVFSVSKISETDFSRLQHTTENIVTLITCVRDVPELRWCIQAREVR